MGEFRSLRRMICECLSIVWCNSRAYCVSVAVRARSQTLYAWGGGVGHWQAVIR